MALLYLSLSLIIIIVASVQPNLITKLSSNSIETRIINGHNAIPHSAPWMVTLQWGVVWPIHNCGGSIIAPTWVLTAGHCIAEERFSTGVL